MCPKNELGGVVTMSPTQAQDAGFEIGSPERGSVQDKYSTNESGKRRSRRPVRPRKRR